MLSIFSCPKYFKGHINIIQRNAIKSWTLLHPKPEIILFGNEEGTAEVCKEFSLRHIPEVERNKFGTPLVSSIFKTGEISANYPIVCYVNADIIILSDFMDAFQNVIKEMDMFLMVGQRWNVQLDEPWDFKNPNYESELRTYIVNNGKIDPPTGIDYFLFPKGLLIEIPPLALGRNRWDNWIIYKVRAMGVPVVDTTPSVTVVHQHHSYSHLPNAEWVLSGPEAKNNINLVGNFCHLYNVWDATHILGPSGLNKTKIFRRVRAYIIRLNNFIKYSLVVTYYPFSLPLILILKFMKKTIKGNRTKSIRK